MHKGEARFYIESLGLKRATRFLKRHGGYEAVLPMLKRIVSSILIKFLFPNFIRYVEKLKYQ